MHILGYGIDIYNETLNKKLNDIKSNCINKVLSILEVLKNDYNITFSYEDIKSLINVNHNLGRVDVAHLLVKNGLVQNIPEAFEEQKTIRIDIKRDDNLKFLTRKINYMR